MKTAMQELIDYLQKEVDDYPEDCIKGIVPREILNGMHHSNLVLLGKVEKLLEKEKEQIIKANIEGTEHGYRESHVFGLDARPYSEKRAEEYYNQTFNQNK